MGRLVSLCLTRLLNLIKLETLDLSYNRINIDELYKLTKLNHLKKLYLRRVMDFSDELVNFNESEISQLKGALSHCEILM